MQPMQSSKDKLEQLRKREAALKNAIALEKVRQQKKREIEDARLHSIIGTALVQNAARHTDFEMMLKSVLQATTSLTDAERKLLITKGWL